MAIKQAPDSEREGFIAVRSRARRMRIKCKQHIRRGLYENQGRPRYKTYIENQRLKAVHRRKFHIGRKKYTYSVVVYSGVCGRNLIIHCKSFLFLGKEGTRFEAAREWALYWCQTPMNDDEPEWDSDLPGCACSARDAISTGTTKA
jgi:hypothetical protein